MRGTKKTEGALATQPIPFGLRRSRRKTLAITVRPDLSVWVAAPYRTPREVVEKRVRRRAVWIRRQQTFFAQFQPHEPPRRFISGETHRYLGRQYRLKVSKSSTEHVKRVGRFMQVFVRRPPDVRRVRALVNEWQRSHARVIFQRNFAFWTKRLKTRLPVAPTLRLRRMPKRWGSCTSRGVISLNPDLIRAPSSCIDYVMVHELCHLIHRRHDARFYSLLESVMRDWKTRKSLLEHLVLG